MNTSPTRRCLPRLVLEALLILCPAACGQREPATMDRYLPRPEAAHAALAAALTDWQNGHPPGAVADTHPQVCVVDNFRRPLQQLEHFEILGEIASDHARGFAVRLTLANPGERQTAQFVVIGIDPLWVYRQEDFENMSHWMHKMDGPVPAATAPPDRPENARPPLPNPPATRTAPEGHGEARIGAGP